MPIYFGHKNSKGLSVSPALHALGIDMLRAAPSQVGAIARPLVVQQGYASYIAHLPAFLKAYLDKRNTPFEKQGYPVNLPLERCIPIENPPLVIDFNGPIPSKHVELLNKIGFERIRVNRTDNIVRFPTITFEQARGVRGMNPNFTTPAPVNTVNLQSFEMWILVLRVVSTLLLAHTYPAFADGEHKMDEFDELTEDLLKRKAVTDLQNAPKRVREEAGMHPNPDEIDIDDDMQDAAEEDGVDLSGHKTNHIDLHKAKPPRQNMIGWGSPDAIPNTSGLFFPYIPELCTYDKVTVPSLIEDFLIQSLGAKPEHQVERMDRIRSAWGVIGQTDSGNAMAHLCKVISLSLRSQGRTFPIIREGVYQGSILSGARLFIGIHGMVHYPVTFDKLQEETGGYHLHSVVLDKIIEIVDDDDLTKHRPDCMRVLRAQLLNSTLTEEERDEVRRLAVHLHFKGDKFLAINSQSIVAVLEDIEDDNDTKSNLPMHHSVLFSRDRVLVSLSAFGYQAPSFMIDNCPRVPLVSPKPPQTLVVRQKPLDLAVVDWKKMLESKEIRNNPRNLSRANRDRPIVGNDKTVIWGKLNQFASDVGGVAIDKSGMGVENIDIAGDGMEDW